MTAEGIDERIIKLLSSKAENGLITFKVEHVVEKLTDVSRSTIQRHLKQLVDNGKLKVVETGKQHGGNTVQVVGWKTPVPNPLFDCDVKKCSTKEPHNHVDGWKLGAPSSWVEPLNTAMIRFLEALEVAKEEFPGAYIIRSNFTKKRFACHHRREEGICGSCRSIMLNDKHGDLMRPLPPCSHEMCQVYGSGNCQEPEADYPKCPKHKGVMKLNRGGNGFFCPRKMTDGSWCEQKAQT